MTEFITDTWADSVTEAVNGDSHFNRIARHFDATVLFAFGEDEYAFTLADGTVTAVHETPKFVSWDVAVRAPAETWETFLSDSRPPFYNDLRSVWLQHDLTIEGDLKVAIQQWRALKYLIDTFGEVGR
jgi:hypothetical protein